MWAVHCTVSATELTTKPYLSLRNIIRQSLLHGKHVEDMETVVEIDDENINSDDYSRAYTSFNTPVLCSEVVDFLDELLGLVPDPALRKK